MEKHSTDSRELFRTLFSEIPEEQIERAEANLTRYLALALRVYRRLHPESYVIDPLTDSPTVDYDANGKVTDYEPKQNQ